MTFTVATASKLSRLFPVIAIIAVIALLLPGPASAQDTAPQTSAQTSADQTSATETLLELLRDETARNALIAELERAAVATTAEPAIAPDAPADMSLGRRIALVTQDAAEAAAARIARLWADLGRARTVFDAIGTREIGVLTDALADLLVVIALTVAVFVVLRAMLMPLYRRLGDRAGRSGLVPTVALFAVSAVLDIAVVLIAWAVAYGVTVFLFGEFGQIGIRQTLYLNAFVLVELVKVGVRSVLSPSTGGLRCLPLNDAAARALNRHVNVVVSILGYGQLLIVPIVNQSASFAAGRAMAALLSVIVLVYLVSLVIRRRRDVADWLMTRFLAPDAQDSPEGVAPPAATPRQGGGFVAALAQGWHLLALVYLAVMFTIVMTRPAPVVTGALVVSGKIALAFIAASLLSGILGRAIARGVALPDDISQRLPLLERRLNRLVPQALVALRAAILAGVVLFAFDATGLIGVGTWLESGIGLRLTGIVVSVAMILAVAFTLWLALTSWVDYRLNPEYGRAPTARETTLLSLLRNAATIVLIVLTLMFCLSEIGLDIGPLLASAGVLGLAIGFGAQKMVQDIITGVFIQFENAINVGDVITVGGTTGGVEKLTVRSVSLRDIHGVFHIIPFSSVDMVSNYTRDFSYYVCDMGIAYRESVEDAREAMQDAFAELRRDPDQGGFVLGDLEWFGVDSFGDNAVVVRARIKTLPGKQWGVGRAYNALLKRIFDARGIEIPFPQQTIWFGEAKDGSTQALRLAGDAAADAS